MWCEVGLCVDVGMGMGISPCAHGPVHDGLGVHGIHNISYNVSPREFMNINMSMFSHHVTMYGANQSTKSHEVSILIQKSCDVLLIIGRYANGATPTSHLHVVYLCVSCATRCCSDLVTGNTGIKRA